MKFRILLFSSLLIICAAYAQVPHQVKLKATAGKFTLKNYCITKVLDDRPDTTRIGIMRAGLRNTPSPVNLKNGVTGAVSDFIGEWVLQSKDKTEIELHIVQMEVSEKTEGGKQQADLSTHFSFFRNGEKMMDYTGTSYIQVALDVSPYIGKLVSQSLENVLKEFDVWWLKNEALYNGSKGNEIAVTAVLKTTSSDEDHIPHSKSFLLTIPDFLAEPDKLSSAVAATYSGFNVEWATQTDQRSTKVKITVLPYFDRSKSWIKPAGKNDYVLKHEQLHFDITGLKATELVNAIGKYTFTAEGFSDEMNALQKKYTKEMEQMQAQYDKETSHGIWRDKQKLWEIKIKEAKGKED